MSNPNITEVIQKILEVAHNAREDAGFSGGSDDGGAHYLEMQVKFYQYGKDGVFPLEWQQYVDLTDPEYETYLRLKQKFKGL